MEKLLITGIWRNERVSKDGKAYVSVSLKTREYGDKYVSGFGAPFNLGWKVGDTIEVDIEKKPGKDKDGNDVEYINFSKPDPLAALTLRVERLEKLLEPKITIQSHGDFNSYTTGTGR